MSKTLTRLTIVVPPKLRDRLNAESERTGAPNGERYRRATEKDLDEACCVVTDLDFTSTHVVPL